MNLFKLAGIELPTTAADEIVVLSVLGRNDVHVQETACDTWAEAMQTLLSDFKNDAAHITFVSIGKRAR